MGRSVVLFKAMPMASHMELVPITSQKHDPAWKHCQMYKSGEKILLKCIYCGKIFKGGGIHRIKEHLAGHKGNAATCFRVPSDVRVQMQESLDGAVVRKRKKQKFPDEMMNVDDIHTNQCHAFPIQCGESTGIDLIGELSTPEPTSSLLVNGEGTSNSLGEKRKRGRPRKSAMDSFVVHLDPSEVVENNANKDVRMAVGRFLFDIGAPPDAVNSAYFQPMIDAIVSGGSTDIRPTYHEMSSIVLKNYVEEMKNEYGELMPAQEKTGVSVLVDECTDEVGRVLLDFFIYCSEGTTFLKSVDASGIIASADALYELLRQVVEEVGVKNVVQVITNVHDQYILAGKRLTDTFSTLYWTPCSAHCIDLILEDFSKLEMIPAIIGQARSITRFVYNHSSVLNMMRKFTLGCDIVSPGMTRSATNFKTLKQMVNLKHNLQAMVTSVEWMNSSLSKIPEAIEMLDLVSSESFWSSCVLITQLTDPLLRVLRISKSVLRPAMGYVYAAMVRAKEEIKKQLNEGSRYTVYWKVIDHHWEQLWHHPLCTAGFYLNPRFFYTVEGDMPNDILSGIFDCIEVLVSDTNAQDKIIREINLYKNAVGDFGRKMAIRARDSMLPDEWWSTYGGGCPNLARLAVRVLSQTCSCKVFEHNNHLSQQVCRTRNCIERKRLEDLNSVTYNLKLRQRSCVNKGHNCSDSMYFGPSSTAEDWITGNDPCSMDCKNSDWMVLDAPFFNSTDLGVLQDDIEDLGAGFHGNEIFNQSKDAAEETVEGTVYGNIQVAERYAKVAADQNVQVSLEDAKVETVEVGGNIELAEEKVEVAEGSFGSNVVSLVKSI